jgi:NCAIR mutase (PurE)-related protein
MVIEKININKIENSLKRVSEESSKLKVLQQDLDNINKNLKEVNFNFLSGKVSDQVYQTSKKSLEKKRKFLIDKVNKNINSILTIVKDLSEVINENKV